MRQLFWLSSIAFYLPECIYFDKSSCIRWFVVTLDIHAVKYQITSYGNHKFQVLPLFSLADGDGLGFGCCFRVLFVVCLQRHPLLWKTRPSLFQAISKGQYWRVPGYATCTEHYCCISRTLQVPRCRVTGASVDWGYVRLLYTASVSQFPARAPDFDGCSSW